MRRPLEEVDMEERGSSRSARRGDGSGVGVARRSGLSLGIT